MIFRAVAWREISPRDGLVFEVESHVMKLPVTGGAGFIDSAFGRHVIWQRSDISILALDKLWGEGANCQESKVTALVRSADTSGLCASRRNPLLIQRLDDFRSNAGI